MLPIRDVNPTRITPVVTWAIIAVNVVVYLFVQPQTFPDSEEFAYEYAAIACEITTGDPVTADEIRSGRCDESVGDPVFPDKAVLLSVGVSMFLHAGLAHILFNMWSLWSFGNNVEEAFGTVGYLLFYLVSGVAATVAFVVLNPDVTVPLVGASGAIAGVMGAYLVLFPRHLVMTLLFFRIVAIPAIFFLGIWFLGQFALVSSDSGVAWEAHVGGFVFGAVVALVLRRVLISRTLTGSRPVRPEPQRGF